MRRSSNVEVTAGQQERGRSPSLFQNNAVDSKVSKRAVQAGHVADTTRPGTKGPDAKRQPKLGLQGSLTKESRKSGNKVFKVGKNFNVLDVA